MRNYSTDEGREKGCRKGRKEVREEWWFLLQTSSFQLREFYFLQCWSCYKNDDDDYLMMIIDDDFLHVIYLLIGCYLTSYANIRLDPILLTKHLVFLNFEFHEILI